MKKFRLRKKITPLTLPHFLRKTLGVGIKGGFRFRYLFIITYGRTGSTLLASYLSAFPGVEVIGENYMFFTSLAEANRRFMNATLHPSGNKSSRTSPWFGSHRFSYPAFKKKTEKLLLSQFFPLTPIPRTIGIKEIRWFDDSFVPRLEQSVLDLEELFPRVGFIVLTRNMEDVRRSAWYSKMNDEDFKKFAREVENGIRVLRDLASSRLNFYFIDYQNMIENNPEFLELHDFLETTFSQTRYDSIFSIKHSYFEK